MTWKIALFIGLIGVLMLILSTVLVRRGRAAAARRPINPQALQADVEAALDRDDLVGAVKRYREHTGAGLVQAKEAVDRIARDRR
ncbi:hypothetical protein Asp14428_13750 [Actinoplanes sp. NBRC 14428]|uniref:Ribosomal L7/L12-like protein n=1 Tax=Pseudosporangium ferrugineum TaxID=439699 RepID=A0A2T0SEM6_9ACTN|nr:hypothetical protein [Pseudosporangium ferrugineum]PRY31864.1 hypothetical protein CLV70_10275 [Pseudosporangium ferrugineum]BCJ49900.1 hypothetical protein Asp14428_13750 [Actinoplanes sp. NBRC 14428]